MHWIEERAVRRGTEAGIPWAVCPHPHLGIYNGYVQIPPDHPLRSLADEFHEMQAMIDLDQVLSVHGGITYCNDSLGWFGFDTAHLGDIWPGVSDMDLDYPGIPQRIWTIDAVEAETRRLARQVADLAKGPARAISEEPHGTP